MRILHTADWHMNNTLGRVDVSDDVRRSLRQIAQYLDVHKVDVMLVAGDLFSERSRPDQLRAAVSDIKDIFLPFLQRGGTIIAISGNHDSEIFFETVRDALDLVAPGRVIEEGTNPTGRLYVAPNPRLLILPGPGGERVQFALMPYPTARAYLRGENASYSNIEQKHRAIQQGYNRTLETLKQRMDNTLPSVLVAHVHVRGAAVHSLYRITEVEDVVFEPGDVPAHWAYVAYGHIHKPQQALAGAAHVRYCGSIIRFDLAEAEDEKSVVLAEVGPSGLVGQPQVLPIQCAPIYRVVINDPDADLCSLRDQYDHAENALVSYSVHWDPARHNLDELREAIQAIFPRWYSREDVEIGKSAVSAAQFSPQQMHDVAGTVRDYLQLTLTAHHQRDAVLALADELLAEEVK